MLVQYNPKVDEARCRQYLKQNQIKIKHIWSVCTGKNTGLQPKTRVTFQCDHRNLSDHPTTGPHVQLATNVSHQWLHFITFSPLSPRFWAPSSCLLLVLRNLRVLSVPNSRGLPSWVDTFNQNDIMCAMCERNLRALPNSNLFACFIDAGGMQPLSFSQVGLIAFIGCVQVSVSLWR